MRVSIVFAVNITASVLVWWHHCLRNNDGYNQTVNAENTRHDNRDNVFDNTGGMINAHVTDAKSGTPSSPGAAPTGQNHTEGCAHVATAKKLNTYVEIYEKQH